MAPKSRMDEEAQEPSPLRRLFDNLQALDEIVDEGEESATHICDLVQAVAEDPAGQEDLLKGLLDALAQEGGREITAHSNAARVILHQRPVGTFITNSSDSIYQAYLDALNRQTPRHNPVAGSADALLDAGMSMAPYLILDKAKRAALGETLSKLSKKFPHPDSFAHIRLQIRAIRERLSPNPRQDAHVEALRMAGLTIKEIADRLTIHPSIVSEIVQRLARLGRVTLSKPKGRPLSDEAIRRDEVVRPLLRNDEDDETQAKRISDELGKKKRGVLGSIQRIRRRQRNTPSHDPYDF